MKTMTLDELKQIPLTTDDKNIIESAQPVITDDCPEMTDDQLENFKPWYEIHQNRQDEINKTSVTIKIDNDILAALKQSDTDYQTKINDILRQVVLG
jgi:uncharacterized protein (DUF4415 family)